MATNHVQEGSSPSGSTNKAPVRLDAAGVLSLAYVGSNPTGSANSVGSHE